MKVYTYIAAILCLALLGGCASTKVMSGNSKLSFEYEGKDYIIKSLNPEDQVGYNILVLNQNDKSVFNAIDKEQDGVIDEVVSGSITVEKAQEIYLAGLSQGKRKGAVKKRYIDRVYRFSDRNNNYVLQTFELAVGQVYNKMLVSDRNTPFFDTIVKDANADGILNIIEKDGNKSLEDYQAYYRDLIARGMMDGRVVKADGKYVVAMK